MKTTYKSFFSKSILISTYFIPLVSGAANAWASSDTEYFEYYFSINTSTSNPMIESATLTDPGTPPLSTHSVAGTSADDTNLIGFFGVSYNTLSDSYALDWFSFNPNSVTTITKALIHSTNLGSQPLITGTGSSLTGFNFEWTALGPLPPNNTTFDNIGVDFVILNNAFLLDDTSGNVAVCNNCVSYGLVPEINANSATIGLGMLLSCLALMIDRKRPLSQQLLV